MSDSPYRAFAERFLATFALPADDLEGRLHVALPPELAAHFGRETLVWTFRPHDPQGELVAYGSRAFEEMLAYLGGHGRLTAVRLPDAGSPPEQTPEVWAGELTGAGEEPATTRYHVFNFQLAFSCDERMERLFTTCLDEEGREQPGVLNWLEADGAAASDVPAMVPSPDLARAAEARALGAAEAWARPMEAAALARLEAVGDRLVQFYEAQMREVPVRRRRGQSDEEAVAEAEDLRWQLRRELERKLRDETARHQMRVQVRLVSQAIVEVPGLRRVYRLAGPRGAREIAITHNTYTREALTTPCERCGEGGGPYGVCAEGHLACAECLDRCGSCGLASCRAELLVCETCVQAGCAGCRTRCASGHIGCASHLVACPGCGMALCPRCERPHGCGLDG